MAPSNELPIPDVVVVEPEQDVSNSNSSDPPDGGYGWVCVAACFMINCFTWGLASQSYGVFLSFYLSQSLYPSATSLDFALIGGFNLSIATLVAPLVTVSARKYGSRLTMLVGICLFGTGYVSASFSHRVWQLYISQGVLVGAGIGFAYIPSLPVLSQWFLKKRSLANGISSGGSGIGGIIFSFLTDVLIRRISLAWAFRIEAILSCSMLLLATALIRNRNEHINPPQRGFDTKLLKQTNVILLLTWLFIGMFGYTTLTYSLPAYGTSIGLSHSQASTVNAVMNVGVFIGRCLTGMASDNFGRIEVAGLLTFLSGVMCFAIWIPAKSYGVLLFYSILAGGTLGVYWVCVGPLSVEVAGLVELQSLLSLSWLVTVLPTTFAEVIALKLRKGSGGNEYLHPQIFSGLSYLCSSICLLLLWQRKRGKERDSDVDVVET
jgi:MFS family permease